MIFYVSLAFGQSQTKLDIALRHIEQNAAKWSLTSSDYANMLVSSEVTSTKGITYLYLNQTHDNIPIRNAVMTVTIAKDGKVASVGNSFVSNAKSKIVSSSSDIQADQAILKAAEHLEVSIKSSPKVLGRSDEGKFTYEMKELCKSNILAELKYEQKAGKLYLVWNLQLDMKANADYWDMNIDAKTGSFVSKHNYTTYCKHHKDAFAHHNNCAVSTFKSLNTTTQKVSKALAARNAAAQYNVYALPVESPNHGGRSIVGDDQYLAASPFGWHDTNGIEGPEFMTTRGNNVYAYQDKDDDDESDGMDTDGGAALNFDFPMDLNKDPRESDDAAVTNLFYMVNMMHDVTTLLGFDEAFGNFQQKNYTNAPGNGDYVLAQAFDGIALHESGDDLDAAGNPTKINNANFSTPSDGFNGRMQMFFWDNQGGSISIDAPETISGFVSEYGGAQFGGLIPLETEAPIFGQVAVVSDGSPNQTTGCKEIVNTADINGKIAMIDRGLCDFSLKVYNAQQAGAIAAIVCNISGVSGGNGEELLTMAGGTNAGSVTIPSIFMKKSDCDKIRLTLDANIPVTMTFQERERMGASYLDGALDNGIIAHEFGHGISNRLTGGRTNAGCLGNDEQMGEGWSDFFSLIMTHEPGDKGEDIRGIGTFATAQQITGGGIRRYPYSTDMSINPQTFDDIKGTTAPHPLGEVWSDMLWDMYWQFVDLYGYDADWSNEESGNFKGAFLVMEGMKMQGCNPGFISGRDAILDADVLHFSGDHQCMIWNVFARRGLGYYAEGGDSDDRNDGKEDFEPLPTCIEKLKISKTATASVNAGDEITVTLKTINHIPERKSSVIITDELPDGLTYVPGSSSNMEPEIVGNLLTFVVGDMEYEQAVDITYKARTSTTNKSTRLVFDNFDNDITWDIDKNEGNEDWTLSNDVYKSPETSFYMINVPAENDASLVSTPYIIEGNNPVMRFWHRYDTELGNDGGFVEISVDNGPYTIIKKDQFVRNEYNGPIAYGTLAIPSLDGFSGTSNEEFIDSYIDMTPYKGKSVVFKFRFGSNETINSSSDYAGWFIDDFEIIDVYKYTAQACIYADNGTTDGACTDAIETLVNSDGTVKADDVDKDFFALSISPNPAKDFIVINAVSPFKVVANVDIMSVEGKNMYQGKMSINTDMTTNTIPTSTLASGMYFVRVQAGSKVSIQKLIIK